MEGTRVAGVAKPTDQPYMGVAEVAAYYGVTKQAVSNWLHRDFRHHRLPKPLVILAMGPIWLTSDIIAHKELQS